MKENILRKDEVVRRQSGSLDRLIEDTIKEVNSILSTATDIPISISVNSMSSSSQVRNELIRLLVQAGWKVEPVVSDNKLTAYRLS